MNLKIDTDLEETKEQRAILLLQEIRKQLSSIPQPLNIQHVDYNTLLSHIDYFLKFCNTKVENLCPHCKRGYLIYTSDTILDSNTSLLSHRHVCNQCGNVEYLHKVYHADRT